MGDGPDCFGYNWSDCPRQDVVPGQRDTAQGDIKFANNPTKVERACVGCDNSVGTDAATAVEGGSGAQVEPVLGFPFSVGTC